MNSKALLKRSIKGWIIFFILALVLSGITAFALETELRWLIGIMDNRESLLYLWINKVYKAFQQTNIHYPFLFYGYDWHAFAHLVIAVAFIGPLRDPVRNKWVIQFGILSCCMVFPLAFIAGYIRGIPIYWQLIDCSFGVSGLVPLCICYYKIQALESLVQINYENEIK